MKRFLKFAAFILIVSISWFIFAKETEEVKYAPLWENFKNFHYPIQTSSPLAQRYFDQGMIFFYSFQYGEAIRSFEAAIKIDPKCSMCYWGLALATGNQFSTPIDPQKREKSIAAINTAMQLVNKENGKEQAFIE